MAVTVVVVVLPFSSVKVGDTLRVLAELLVNIVFTFYK